MLTFLVRSAYCLYLLAFLPRAILCLINIVEKLQTSLIGLLALWLERLTPEAKFIIFDLGIKSTPT